MSNAYENPVGLWRVTTEGDEEGRSIRDLGIHQGHMVDIAKKLGRSSFYKLTFHAIEIDSQEDIAQDVPKSVSIGMDIESGTWDMSVVERQQFFADLFADRKDVTVEPGCYYASVKLDFTAEVEKQKRERQAALGKLTPRERALLGIK